MCFFKLNGIQKILLYFHILWRVAKTWSVISIYRIFCINIFNDVFILLLKTKIWDSDKFPNRLFKQTSQGLKIWKIVWFLHLTYIIFILTFSSVDQKTSFIVQKNLIRSTSRNNEIAWSINIMEKSHHSVLHEENGWRIRDGMKQTFCKCDSLNKLNFNINFQRFLRAHTTRLHVRTHTHAMSLVFLSLSCISIFLQKNEEFFSCEFMYNIFYYITSKNKSGRKSTLNRRRVTKYA